MAKAIADDWFVIVDIDTKQRTLVNLLLIESIRNFSANSCELVFPSGKTIQLVGTQAGSLLSAFAHIGRVEH
jgi:hypothetical protein